MLSAPAAVRNAFDVFDAAEEVRILHDDGGDLVVRVSSWTRAGSTAPSSNGTVTISTARKGAPLALLMTRRYSGLSVYTFEHFVAAGLGSGHVDQPDVGGI